MPTPIFPVDFLSLLSKYFDNPACIFRIAVSFFFLELAEKCLRLSAELQVHVDMKPLTDRGRIAYAAYRSDLLQMVSRIRHGLVRIFMVRSHAN